MKLLLRPSAMMFAVWAVFSSVHFIAPVKYVHAPGAMAWAIMIAGTVLFCAGSLVGEGRYLTQSRQSIRVDSFAERAVFACTALGFFGIICIAIDKLLLSDLDWSHGMSDVRELRSNQVMANIDIKRSPILYVGYLTFSFSCASCTLFLLRGDVMSIAARWCGQLSVATMVGYALLYGGRMPVLLLILIMIGAAFVRRLAGRSVLPKNNWMWPKILVVAAAFVIYSNHIWEVRRTANRILDYEEFARRAEERWQMRPSEWLDKAIRRADIPNESAMNWISFAMYLTHSPTTVQRIVDNRDQLSLYGGLYQIGIFSPLADKLVPSLKLPQTMRAELMKAEVYGWFPSAWGAWLADAGVVLGAVCVFLWGLLSGLAFRFARTSSALDAELLLCFAYAAILGSPINGPFGMANAFLILLSFCAVTLAHRLNARRSSQRPSGNCDPNLDLTTRG